MVVFPCAHTLELRWDLDQLTTKLVGTDDQFNHCVRKWIIFYVWFEYNIKCENQLIVVEIPFLSTNLSFNMTQLPRYRLVLDSTYFEVNGTYFKT